MSPGVSRCDFIGIAYAISMLLLLLRDVLNAGPSACCSIMIMVPRPDLAAKAGRKQQMVTRSDWVTPLIIAARLHVFQHSREGFGWPEIMFGSWQMQNRMLLGDPIPLAYGSGQVCVCVRARVVSSLINGVALPEAQYLDQAVGWDATIM